MEESFSQRIERICLKSLFLVQIQNPTWKQKLDDQKWKTEVKGSPFTLICTEEDLKFQFTFPM